MWTKIRGSKVEPFVALVVIMGAGLIFFHYVPLLLNPAWFR